MGHKYVKEDDTFNTSQNGVVPKPTAQDISNNKFLRADGSWASGAGGSVVSADQIVSSGTEIGGVTIDGQRTAFYAPPPKHNYSTTEKIVGVSIDGKPVYEKTFTGNLSTAANIIVTTDPTMRPIEAEGFIANDVSRMQIGGYISNAYYSSWYYFINDGGLYLFYGSVYQGNAYTYEITVRYTKTTDNA